MLNIAVSMADMEVKTPGIKAVEEKKPEVKLGVSVNLKAEDRKIKTSESDKTKVSDRGISNSPFIFLKCSVTALLLTPHYFW